MIKKILGGVRIVPYIRRAEVRVGDTLPGKITSIV